MKVITQREFRNNSAAVMDAVDAGSLVGLVLSAGRDPRPRRMDLMIAAIASSRDLPLYTRNPSDFKGLEGLLRVLAV
jgi:predicted nucleic acid-binding protein